MSGQIQHTQPNPTSQNHTLIVIYLIFDNIYSFIDQCVAFFPSFFPSLIFFS